MHEGGIGPPGMIHRVYRIRKLFGVDEKGGAHIMDFFDILIDVISLSAVMFQVGFYIGRLVERLEQKTESKSNPRHTKG